jgi:hypothetical protein
MPLSRSPTRPETSLTGAASAPTADDALRALARRGLRATVFLFVRLVGVALLVSIWEATGTPGLQRVRLLVDGVAALLVVLPFFTAYGRIFAWRIALGRAYVGGKRWSDAERTLAPLDRKGYHPFDAAGEGAYWLALTRRAQGRDEEARRLLKLVARHGSGRWKSDADAALRRAANQSPSSAIFP